MPGVVVEVHVSEGQAVTKGQEVLILEAMKMENAIMAPHSGVIQKVLTKTGAVVSKGDVLVEYHQVSSNSDITTSSSIESTEVIPIRLQELRDRKSYLPDGNRPKAQEKRRSKGQNTARENIERLVDTDSFREYGGLVVAAQRSRRSEADLIQNTPADGLITGIAKINGQQCLIMAYDYTVLAGTQGTMNHMKMDRVIAVAKERQLPVVLFAEGGGGRPGDVDVQTIAGLYISTFVEYASLRGVVPTIAIVSGYCFAGNAALAGSSDIIIGTDNISIGMGGPAMIEGGGLGQYHPREVGPADVQVANGVIDLLVKDEDEAIEATKKYLGFCQGYLEGYEEADQSILQDIIPSNRKRNFEIRKLINTVADIDSVLELQKEHGRGMITCLARVRGWPLGIIANDSSHEAGAITSENARKAAAFLEKCNDYRLPLLSLIDTPGIMVGPVAEKEGTVKSAGSMFVAGARFAQPMMSIVVRRAYGLGAMAMMGGSTRKSAFTISWPSGEFGAMGLEGAVKLGFRKELEAIADHKEREQMYDQMVAEAYERGKALSMATMFEIDEVIEPNETRKWITSILTLAQK